MVETSPWGQQHLLDRAVWDMDGLRDFTRRYVVEGLADDGEGAGPGGCGVLVVDETGFAKREKASAGVARQYSGALGGVFPCQIGVMAAWATGAGQALVDRDLYLPKAWTEDRPRCRAAYVPDEVVFATKSRLAEATISRILPDLPKGRVWVAADEVYGRDGAFRGSLEEHHLPYVVNVQADHTVLPRPGWRHLARLGERVAAEDEWGRPARRTQPARQSHLAVVGPPDPRSGGRTRGVGAVDRGPPPPRGARKPGLLHGAGADRDRAGRDRSGSWCPLAGGRSDQAGEVRLWAGRLRSAVLPWLVSAHHPAQLAAAFLAVSDAQAAREDGPLAVNRFGADPPTGPMGQRGGSG